MQVHEVLSYLGPGRRSERTVVEWKIELTEVEMALVNQASAVNYSSLRDLLRKSELGPLCRLADEDFPRVGVENSGQAEWRSSPQACLLETVARMALAIQRSGGHRVDFHDLVPCVAENCLRMVYESEHLDIAISAGELAFRMCAEAIPGLLWQPDSLLPGDRFSTGVNLFLEQAADSVLPLDTAAIIAAAARRDIPCVKLEREPYAGLKGEFRIQRNGLLRLGHSRFQRIVDGSLCLERNASLVPLLFDRSKLYPLLNSMQLPVARQDTGLQHLVTAKRAVKAAERLGYPVVVKPLARQPSKARANTGAQSRFPALHSADEVRQYFDRIAPGHQGVIVEQCIPGEALRLLLAGRQVFAAVMEAAQIPLEKLHSSLIEIASNIAGQLETGLLVITLVSTDYTRPLEETGGAVIGLDPAPDVHGLLGDSPELIQVVFDAFLGYLFPPGSKSRIPLIAVTGTNGKTTTSKMVAHIMQASGYRIGMASTLGVFANQSLRFEGDLAGMGGHHHVFESREVDLGVLETARGGVASSGFMFDHCDVGVCLNVSEDHLGQYGVNTLEDMVRIKRSVLERARKAIIINADYQTCLDMLPFAPGPVIYAVSLSRSAKELGNEINEAQWLCVCEFLDSEEWIVLQGPAGQRLQIMPVSRIPATLDGKVRFNISNAQHAICAAHALGLDADVIATSLSGFDSSFENNPGRMNIYRGLPFTVIMDYVHNTDGMLQLGRYLEAQEVKGRKILMYAVTSDRTMETFRAYTVLPVNMFDHFVCRLYPGRRSAKNPEFPGLMKQALVEAGVNPECITVVDAPENGAKITLSLARPGDLVVLSAGTKEFASIWQQVLDFDPDNPKENSVADDPDHIPSLGR